MTNLANQLLAALHTADRTFAENGLLASHAARQEIRAAVQAAEPMSAPTAEPVAFVHWPISGPPRLVWYSNAALEDAILKTHKGHQPDLLLYATPPSAATPEPSDADWADFGAWAERDKGAMDMLEKLIDVWDDGQLPHEHRCYVDGTWSELIAEARAAIHATKGGKL